MPSENGSEDRRDGGSQDHRNRNPDESTGVRPRDVSRFRSERRSEEPSTDRSVEGSGDEDRRVGQSGSGARPVQQAASRAAGVISRFLTELDPQPFTEAISPLTQRLGLTSELDNVAVETTLLFSDLAGFSRWVLTAGDDQALSLLREMGRVNEPLISAHRGRLVKRLGSGHMAAFQRPRDGLATALGMLERTSEIAVADLTPGLRIGLHLGTPQRVGGDYFGRDVNVAARLADAAAPGEILASGQLISSVGSDRLAGLRVQRRGFRAKGAPEDLEVYSITNPLI